MKILLSFIKVHLILLLLTPTAYTENVLSGFHIGDDNAPITVIEYRSMTCSHCAEFSNDVFTEVKNNYIDTGKVKFELRPFVLNAVDLVAFKLMHCVDEADFLQLDKTLFKDQDKWLVTDEKERVLENSTDALKKYALLYGLSETDFSQCLESEEIENFILQMRVDGSDEYKINSTPTFIIDGKIHAGNMPYNEFEKLLN